MTMNDGFSIRVVRNRHGGAKVYINGEEVSGNRLVQITVDLTGGCEPEVHLVYRPDSFFMEAPHDD